jgi:hypothetical protein
MLGNNTLNNVVFKNDGGSPTNTQLALANTTAIHDRFGDQFGRPGDAASEVNDLYNGSNNIVPITFPLGVLTITGSITSTSSNVGTVSTLAGRYILGASTTITGSTLRGSILGSPSAAPISRRGHRGSHPGSSSTPPRSRQPSDLTFGSAPSTRCFHHHHRRKHGGPGLNRLGRRVDIPADHDH